jgi:hypothetical protein
MNCANAGSGTTVTPIPRRIAAAAGEMFGLSMTKDPNPPPPSSPVNV